MKYNFKSLLNSFNGVLIEGTNFTNAEEILDNLKNSKLKINGLSTVKFFADKSFNMQTFTNALQSFIDAMKRFNPSTVGDAVKLLFMKNDAGTFLVNASPDPYIAYFKYKNVRDKPENIKALFDLFPKKNNDDHSFEKKILEHFDNSKNAKMSESDVETFYNGNGWKVFTPKTYGAAQKLSWLNGKKIPWCTAADPDHFQYYTKIGKLICFINDKEDLAFQFNGAEKVMDKNDKFFEEVNLKDKNDEPRGESTTLNQIETIFSSIPQEVLVKIFGNKVYGNWQMLLKNKNKPKSAISLKPVEERNGFKRFVARSNKDIDQIISDYFKSNIHLNLKNEDGISKIFFSKQLGAKNFKTGEQLWIGKYKDDDIVAFASKGDFSIYKVVAESSRFRMDYLSDQEERDTIRALLAKKDGAERKDYDNDTSTSEYLKSGILFYGKRTNEFDFTFFKPTAMNVPQEEKVTRFTFKDYGAKKGISFMKTANVQQYNSDIGIYFYGNRNNKIQNDINGDFEKFKKLNPEIWQELKSSNIIKKHWIGAYREALKRSTDKGDVKTYRTIREEILELYKGVLS